MIKLKSLIQELYRDGARFGIGAIDSNGAVQFQEKNRDIMSSQSHGILGNPWGRNRFRYYDGTVEWSDCVAPDEEQKHIVDTYLERKGFPVKKHISVFYDLDESKGDV